MSPRDVCRGLFVRKCLQHGSPTLRGRRYTALLQPPSPCLHHPLHQIMTTPSRILTPVVSVRYRVDTRVLLPLTRPHSIGSELETMNYIVETRWWPFAKDHEIESFEENRQEKKKEKSASDKTLQLARESKSTRWKISRIKSTYSGNLLPDYPTPIALLWFIDRRFLRTPFMLDLFRVLPF